MRKLHFVFLVSSMALTALLWSACAGSRRPVEGEKVLRHTVQIDETLEEIAEDYYGDPGRADEIARFNEVSGDEMIPGAVLRVPMTPKELEALHHREKARPPYNEGLALAERGSYLDATERFQQAIDLDPGFAEAWFNLALTHQRLGVLGRAVDEYKKAVKLRPQNTDYRYALGGVYFHMEKYREAIATFEKTLKIDARHRKAQYSLALAYEKAGQVARARVAWERYLELDDTSEWADQARSHLESLQ